MKPHSPTSPPSRATLLAKQIKREWWWVSLCLVFLSALLSFYREELNIKRLDLTFYDFQSTYAQQFKFNAALPPKKTALIIIDDESIMRVGYWPWRRIEYARALDYLSQAKAVGLDIFFHDKNPAYPTDDDFLAYALESHGRVVLPNVINEHLANETPSSYMPVEPLAKAAAALGYINVPADGDGVVRRTNLYRQTAQNNQHFVLALLQAAGDTQKLQHILNQAQGPTRLIPFRGPPESFDIYSFADVVEGKFNPSTFKDRYVLIGAWSSGLGDFYPTPLSTDEQTSMSGVEVLANILENTLDDHWIYSLPTWAVMLLSGLPIIFICIMLRHLRPRRAIISTALVLAMVFIGNWVLLNIFNIWVPPTASLIGTILAYPVWYWRSQEVVLKHINNEISDMRAHDPTLRIPLEDSAAHSSLPERLSHLHTAIALLRKAQQQREETLRFISHDMRAPQNSILALVDMRRNQQLELSVDQMLDHVENYANITLNLVDDFINLAKVEAMELNLESVYLNDILVEVCDDAWLRAQAKNIQVSFIEPENGVWVKASPALLKRALANLIDNAIKYSSEHTQIHCLVKPEPTLQQVTIVIKDEGWGIAPEALPTIFQAFKRAHTEQQNTPNGSGLGLAFVQAVILRHFGEISVSSEVNVGTTFVLHLPIDGAEQTK